MRTILAIVVVLTALPAAGAVRYASPGGNGDACSAAKPCSIEKAIRKAACGDTVTAASGTYGGIRISGYSCPTGKRLVVASATPQGAILDIATGNGIAIDGSNFVTVRGFRINQHAGAGFGVQVNGGKGIVLKDITVLGDTTTCKTVPEIGDHVYAFDTTGLVLDGLNVGKIERGECNYVEDTTCFTLPRNSSLTMQNCTCHDIRNFGNFSNSSNLLIQDNVVVNLHNHGMGMVDVTNATVQRNVFYATSTATNIADVLWLVCSHGINFRNNLVQGTKVFPVGAFTSHPNCANSANSDKVANDWKGNDGIVHANNIYIDLGSPGNGQAISLWNAYWSPGTPFRSNYNLFNGNNIVGKFEPMNYKTLEQWRAAKILGLEQDAESITSRPTFVNEAGRDYRPANATSPQVDAGDDANCANTIVGAHCDIGPYEYGGAAKRP
jgi:hypothetical protein